MVLQSDERPGFRTQGLSAIAAVLILAGCLVMQPHGAFDSTASFIGFSIGAGLMLLGFGLGQSLTQISAGWFWGVAVLSRLALLPMAPGDDIWRYLWEGYLQTLGFSPYGQPPNAEVLIPYRTDWWALMSFHDTAAIYPPVAQLGFWLLAQVGLVTGIGLSVLLFKLAFALADLAVCVLLSRRFGLRQSLFYAWNPLVIYSFAGGGHYDSWFILPIVAAWLLAERRRWRLSAYCLGISVGVKWVSLPLLVGLVWIALGLSFGSLLKHLLKPKGLGRALLLLSMAALPLLITTPRFCQLGSCTLVPTQSSFVENGRSAELLPYLLQQVWPASAQQNWIFALPLAIAILGLLWCCRRFGSFAQAYFLVLLCLSPIVHGWYFTWLMPFGVASRSWGLRLLSVSAFVYFLLPYRQFSGLAQRGWYLSEGERALLWLPLLLGLLWQTHTSLRREPHQVS